MRRVERRGENVETLFQDVVRQMRFNDNVANQRERERARKELAKTSGLPALLPWNWGKKAKCARVEEFSYIVLFLYVLCDLYWLCTSVALSSLSLIYCGIRRWFL